MYDYLLHRLVRSKPPPTTGRQVKASAPAGPGDAGTGRRPGADPRDLRTSSDACSRAVILLLVVTAVTFAIFFLRAPTRPARPPTSWPPSTWARTPTPAPSRRSRRTSASTSRSTSSTGTSSRASSSGATTTFGPRRHPLRTRPASATPSRPTRGVAAAHRALPVTAVARRRRRRDLAGLRCRDRRPLRAQARHRSSTALSMGVALAGVSLPIFFTGLVLLACSPTSGPICGNVPVRAVHPESRAVGAEPVPALDHASPSCTPRCTPGSPAPACWRRWARTTSAPPAPRACPSGR